jgi:DNA-binding transcriptional LysR family regulator
MSRRYYNLPPFTALASFEAAARHQSFKIAAQELSVTPGAVSHQIKALEQDLGTTLFLRQHRGVELTPDGAALYDTLTQSFRQISRHVSRLRQPDEPDMVTVGSTTAVAALWLSPAVIRFWRDHPDVNVHQVTQDRPFQDAGDFDFFISYGRVSNPALSHTPIYRDDLIPVAAPALADTLQSASLNELASQRLIHLRAASPSWTNWRDWFDTLGHTGPIADGTRVTSYSVALQIARKGAGIALGWRRLVQPMIDSGKLATIGMRSVPAPHRFYLSGPHDTDLSEGALALKTWLLGEIGDPKGESDSL